MSKIGRREFVGSALVGSAGLLALQSPSSADARIEVLINEPIGTISPDIYGHFIEHLGGVIYDGVWVGEQLAAPSKRQRLKNAWDSRSFRASWDS